MMFSDVVLGYGSCYILKPIDIELKIKDSSNKFTISISMLLLDTQPFRLLKIIRYSEFKCPVNNV